MNPVAKFFKLLREADQKPVSNLTVDPDVEEPEYRPVPLIPAQKLPKNIRQREKVLWAHIKTLNDELIIAKTYGDNAWKRARACNEKSIRFYDELQDFKSKIRKGLFEIGRYLNTDEQ